MDLSCSISGLHLDWWTNMCLSSESVRLALVILNCLNAFSNVVQLVDVLTLSHQLLAVSHCVMDAYGDELLADDLRQPGGFKQTHNLAGWVGKDWLDVVCLQIPDPLLYNQHKDIST